MPTKISNRSKAALAFKDGFVKGVRTGAFLLRVMIPIYAAVVILRHTPAIEFLQENLASVMGVFSLPGDAAVPIVTGIFSDEYGVVAAMRGFSFSPAAITVIAMIVLCFHTIPLEAAVGQTIGFHPAKYSLYRFSLAIATGIFAGWLAALALGGGAGYGAGDGIIGGADAPVAAMLSTPFGSFALDSWQGIFFEILSGVIFNVALSLARVIIPLMILIEFMLAYKVVDRIAPAFRWLCRVLGISNDALLPLLVGLLMGVTYGAGTLIEINKRTPLSNRDLTLIGVFLYACHGIIETTVLFAVAGANVLFVCFLRLGIAVLVTAIAARLPRFAA
ncbi:MAG: hypothetical protein LBG50_01850 [Clostridiales Family XIII bacterium]|jgi:hypothetical protein|nr:hypothetical protein [Clostridiales Family XIII bacterium]